MTKAPEQNRVEKLRRLMDTAGMDAILSTLREGVRYLTGFSGSAGSVLVTRKKIFLVTDFRYALQARHETRGVTIVIQKMDWAASIREAAERAGVRRLAFDESSLTVERLKKLRRLGLGLEGRKDLVADLRQVKDGPELLKIKRAIDRAEKSFRELRRRIRHGITERELGLRLEYLMREKGSRRAAFDIIVASGKNGAMPHASVTNRRLRKGDLVTIDFGAEADGYFCDITRTVCVGATTARQREIHGLVIKAQQAAIDMVRPGMPCKDIDAAARGVIERSGYGRQFGHATGHGIGLMVHERPSLSMRSKDRIAEGMVFTVEPGIYVPGWGGVRIEDMVLATRNGAVLLTSLPRVL